QQQQQERRADAAPMPVVFPGAGCRWPLGDTGSWALSDEESGCILVCGAAASGAAGPERKVSKLPGECG
ncbi:MS18A protein, partial [Nicator chloris]|nr:MS18A protein [Nicator chloris]